MEQGVMGVTMFFDTLSCFIFIPFLSLPDNPDEMNKFELTSAYHPTGDQPEAIAQLTEGVREGVSAQTLLGVTGSGKTFTIANVIANINKPTLILSHNKTLAAQLYSEFKGFFPNNAVEYYVSYYDYYQPEAYLPSSDTYIEKDLAINDEIDKLRLAATSAGRAAVGGKGRSRAAEAERDHRADAQRCHVHRRAEGPGLYPAAQRRKASVQLHAVAGRLCRAGGNGRSVAGLYPCRPGRCH